MLTIEDAKNKILQKWPDAEFELLEFNGSIKECKINYIYNYVSSTLGSIPLLNGEHESSRMVSEMIAFTLSGESNISQFSKRRVWI